MTLNNDLRKFNVSTRRRTRTRTESEIAELAQLEDAALVALCLERDEHAWREFMRRYEPTLRANVRGTISYALRKALGSDAIDEVMGDFYVRILERDMLKLRNWHAAERKGAVMALLTMICNGIAIDHARHAFDDMAGRCRAVDKRREADRDPNRGAMWFAIEDRNTREPIKKRRNRKSSDDQ